MDQPVPYRRVYNELRLAIDEYRRMVADLSSKAAITSDAVAKQHYIKLAQSYSELADTLQGRPSKK